MSNPVDIRRLFYKILFKDICLHKVKEDDLKTAIDNMSQVYKAHTQSLSSETRQLADYNTVAHRCAYLHKYAPFHTALVSDILRRILCQRQDLFWNFQQSATTSKFKICSLGGGPGTDIVGAVAALTSMFGLFPCSARVVDIKSDWKDTLRTVIQEMRSGEYGILGQCFSSKTFDWGYLIADLLDEVEGDVEAAIGKADLVTMVKFVSAAACLSTETMLMKIFMRLKTGTMVLFIDNSSGGFRQLVSKAAENCNLMYVCGPINYEKYTNEYFNVTLFDYPSCFSTTVTIHMWQKLNGNSNGAKNILQNKIIKSNVNESSTPLQVQSLNVPKSSVRQKSEIYCKDGDEKIPVVCGESDIINTEMDKENYSEKNGSIFTISTKSLRRDPELSVRHEAKICCQADDGELNSLQAECLVENVSTSKAHAGMPSEHRNNNTVLNSTLEADNGKLNIINSESATDNLSIQNGLINMTSKNSSSAMADSTSTVEAGNKIPCSYNNPSLVVDSLTKAINGNPAV